MARTVKKDANLQQGQPLKPSNLSEQAAAEWDRLTGELKDAGIAVTSAHRSLLSLAATLAADIKDAWAHVEKDGAYIEAKAGLVAHPASKRLDALRRDLVKVLATLGLRTAVASEPKDGTPSLADVLKG